MDNIYYIIFIDTSFGYSNDLHKYCSHPNLFFGQIRNAIAKKKFIPALLDKEKVLEVAQRMSISGIMARGSGWIVPVIGVVIIGYKISGSVNINKTLLRVSEDDSKQQEYENMLNEAFDIVEYTKNNQKRAIINESVFDKLVPVEALYFTKTTMDPTHAFSLLKSAHDLFGLSNENINTLEQLYKFKDTFVKLKEMASTPIEIEQKINTDIDGDIDIDFKKLYKKEKLKYLQAKKYAETLQN